MRFFQSLLVASLVLLVSLTGGDVGKVTAQVISPSTAPQTHQRNMAAATASDTTPAELAKMEPSRRLLVSLDSVIPFPVVGSEAEVPLQEAARKFLTGSVDETVQSLEILRTQFPDIPPVPALMANMLYVAGKADLGRQWLEKTALEHPGHPTAFLAFARFSAAQKRLADTDAMLEKVSRLIESGTWSEDQQKLFRVEFLDIQTDLHINRQQMEQARTCLLELRDLLTNNGKVIIRLAQVEFDLGNVDASFNYLQDAAKLSQNIRMPEVILSGWFQRKRNFEQSEKWMTSAAANYPENVSVQIDYGRWLLQSEKIPEAREVVNKAEQLGGDAYIIGYLKGQIAFAQRSYELAAMHFEELLKLKPSDADAANMLALSLIESNDPTKQSRALELAMVNQRLYPKSPGAMATLGWIYYRTGKKAEAERAFNAVIASNNAGAASAYYVAHFLNDRGDFAGAKRLLEQTLANPDYFIFRRAAVAMLKEVAAKVPETGPPPQTPKANDDGSRK